MDWAYSTSIPSLEQKHSPPWKIIKTSWYRIKVARAWRETTPVCSGLTTRAGSRGILPSWLWSKYRERARIMRRAQDGCVHSASTCSYSLPSSSYPARSTLMSMYMTDTFCSWEKCHFQELLPFVRVIMAAYTYQRFVAVINSVISYFFVKF